MIIQRCCYKGSSQLRRSRAFVRLRSRLDQHVALECVIGTAAAQGYMGVFIRSKRLCPMNLEG